MRSRGFTLIEVLVVLVIIGIIVSLATMAMRDNRGEQLEQEARRLSALMQLASEEAVLTSAPIGVRFFADGYVFLRRQQDQWTPINDDRQLREREIPEPLRLELSVLGQTAAQAQDGKQPEQPQVIFVSSGELEPEFEVAVSHPDLEQRYRILAHPDGRFEFHAEE